MKNTFQVSPIEFNLIHEQKQNCYSYYIPWDINQDELLEFREINPSTKQETGRAIKAQIRLVYPVFNYRTAKHGICIHFVIAKAYRYTTPA